MALLVQSRRWPRRSSTRSARDEQKDEFLAPALKGEKIAALGVSEPELRLRRRAASRRPRSKVGDDYVINGAKMLDHQRHARRLHHAGGAHRRGRLRRHLAGDASPPTSRASRSRARSTRSATTPRTRPSSPSRTAASPRATCSARRTQGFYYIMTNFQGERLIARRQGGGRRAAGARRRPSATRTEREAFGRPILKFQVWRHKFAELADGDRGRALAHLPRRRPLQPQAGRGQGDLHGQAVRRRAAQQVADRCLQSTAASATSTSSPSRGSGATRASSPSAAAPPRS